MSTPVYVSATGAVNTPGNTSVNIAYPPSIAAGNLLLLFVSIGSTFNIPSGWTQLGTSNNGGNVQITVYGKLASGSESGNLGLTYGSSPITVEMHRYTGNLTTSLAAACPTASFNANTSSNTWITAVAISAPSYQLMIACAANGANSNASSMTVTGAGWTNIYFIPYPYYSITTAKNDGSGAGVGATMSFNSGVAHGAALSFVIVGVNSSGGGLFFGSL